MYITITSAKVTPEQSPAMDKFLADFLPRFSRFPGVLAVYYCSPPEKGDSITVTVWESEEAAKSYRASDLIKEPMAFEKAHNQTTTRVGYPVAWAADKASSR
jgi:heme-degrading monooxygenase HmoA